MPTPRPTPASPGAQARSLALLLAASLATLVGCENSRELPITVVLPADTSDYEQANNASIVLRPSGDVFSFSVNGLDFSLELEGQPDTELQQLELYLARDDELIGWGQTAGFATAGSDLGLALFLGRPGQLSTWPDILDSPDPRIRGALARERGMILLQADGDTFLLNQFTLLLEGGARLPDTVAIAPEDGGLYGAADGTVVRLGFEQTTPLAWRYDPSADTWSELSVDGAETIEARPGAASLVDPDGTRVYVLGGGDLSEGIAIDLLPDDEGELAAAPIADFSLAGPRAQSTALWIPRDDNPTAEVLLVGGEALGPLVQRSGSSQAEGPELAWRNLACAIRSQTATDVHVLCVGGNLDDQPTADALAIVIDADSIEIEVLPDFLPMALPDPLLLGDDVALYAQGETRWFRIEREDASVSEPDTAPLRARGGDLVSLPNSVTFLVGGTDLEGTALDRWQVFTPAVEP